MAELDSQREARQRAESSHAQSQAAVDELRQQLAAERERGEARGGAEREIMRKMVAQVGGVEGVRVCVGVGGGGGDDVKE
jgi:hypothetical protein